MATNLLDVEIELLRATTEIIIAIIESDRAVGWVLNKRINIQVCKEDTMAIADALREGIKLSK